MVVNVKILQNLAQIPERELYRIGVDGYLHARENGADGYEKREPGSVMGLFKGFAFMLDHLSIPELTVDFIKSLHIHYTISIQGFLINNKTPHGVFRTWMTTGHDDYSKKCVSFAGLIEIFQWLDNNYHYGLEFEYNGQTFVFNVFNKEQIFSILAVDNITQLAAKIFLPDATAVKLIFYPHPDIERAVSKVVEDFNLGMKQAASKSDKVALAVKTCWILEHIHPFSNGNSRTFIGLLIWILMRIEGVSNIAIFERPLNMTGHSIKENIAFVEESIQNTAILLEQKQLFSYITPSDSKDYGASLLREKILELVSYCKRNQWADYKPNLTIEQCKILESRNQPSTSVFLAEALELANLGVAKAQYTLSVCYALGRETPQDISKSLEWLKQAVALDFPPALRMYGLYYWSRKEIDEAAKWFKKMICFNYDKSLFKDYFFYIGYHYYVQRNFDEAIFWLKIASSDGNNFAQHYFAFCSKSHGTPEQQRLAHRYLNLKIPLVATELKQLSLFRAAIQYANNTCILGASNRYNDLERTGGWSYNCDFRNTGGIYSKTLQKTNQHTNLKFCTKTKRLLTDKSKQWFYQPQFEKYGDISLKPIIPYLDPLNNPRFNLSINNKHLLQVSINAQSLRFGNCGVRASLVAKYLWEHHANVIYRIERVAMCDADHSFIIVNREVNDINSGWVLDPWWTKNGKIYPLSEYKNQLPLFEAYRKRNEVKMLLSGIVLPQTRNSREARLETKAEIFPSHDSYPSDDKFKRIEDYYVALDDYSMEFRLNISVHKQNHEQNFKPCLESIAKSSFFKLGKRKLSNQDSNFPQAKRSAFNMEN